MLLCNNYSPSFSFCGFRAVWRFVKMANKWIRGQYGGSDGILPFFDLSLQNSIKLYVFVCIRGINSNKLQEALSIDGLYPLHSWSAEKQLKLWNMFGKKTALASKNVSGSNKQFCPSFSRICLMMLRILSQISVWMCFQNGCSLKNI